MLSLQYSKIQKVKKFKYNFITKEDISSITVKANIDNAEM